MDKFYRGCMIVYWSKGGGSECWDDVSLMNEWMPVRQLQMHLPKLQPKQ